MANKDAIDANTLLRYLPLINAIESDGGYGQYLIVIHGKRPMKIAKIEPAHVLEHMGA